MSHQSAIDKGDNKMIPGAAHVSPGICLTVARRQSDEDSATSHPLKWDSLAPNDVGRIA